MQLIFFFFYTCSFYIQYFIVFLNIFVKKKWIVAIIKENCLSLMALLMRLQPCLELLT